MDTQIDQIEDGVVALDDDALIALKQAIARDLNTGQWQLLWRVLRLKLSHLMPPGIKYAASSSCARIRRRVI